MEREREKVLLNKLEGFLTLTLCSVCWFLYLVHWRTHSWLSNMAKHCMKGVESTLMIWSHWTRLIEQELKLPQARRGRVHLKNGIKQITFHDQLGATIVEMKSFQNTQHLPFKKKKKANTSVVRIYNANILWKHKWDLPFEVAKDTSNTSYYCLDSKEVIK